MALKFSMILQAVDRFSAPMRRVEAAAKKVTDRLRTITGGAAPAARAIDRATRATETMSRRMASAARAAGRLAGRAGMGALKLGAYGAGYAIGSVTRKILGLVGSLAKWGAASAGAAAGFSIFDTFRKAAQFEQFQMMLEGTEGSAAKAKQAMSWVQDFAQRTPYELDDVMAAFVQMKAYGIDPVNGSLAALGDAAAGMSKDLMQAVEALADAQTGEFERLKEFGIRASKSGDQVTFTYLKNGKDIRKSVKMTATEVQKALTGIFSDRFGGMMDRQSKTLSGLLSNLSDQWLRFQLMVADAGIFDRVKDGVQALLDRVNRLAENGKLQEWAEKVSTWLEKAWIAGEKFVTETDWQSVADGIGSIANALISVVGLIGRAAGAWSRWQKEIAARNAENAETGWLNSPRQRAEARMNRQQIERDLGRPVTQTGKDEAERSKAMLSGTKWRPMMKRPAVGKDNSQGVKVSGRTQVDINVNGPATAKVASLQPQNSNVPMDVRINRTGLSMAGAA